MGRKRDIVFRNFFEPAGDNSSCKLCGKQLKGSYISNIKRHLLDKHSKIYNDLLLESSSFEVEWDQETVLNLIKLWKDHVILYDSESTHNRKHRAEALEVIANELRTISPTITANDVKLKLYSLTSQYKKEWQKMKQSEMYEPTSYWFNEVHFLKDFIKLEKTNAETGSCTGDDPLEERSLESPIQKKMKLNSEEQQLDEGSTNVVSWQLCETADSFSDKDTVLMNFLKTNIRDITDSDLKDDMYQEIVNVIYEYKKKQRALRKSCP